MTTLDLDLDELPLPQPVRHEAIADLIPEEEIRKLHGEHADRSWSRWMAAGKTPTPRLQIGKAYYYTPASVRAWLKTCEMPPPRPPSPKPRRQPNRRSRRR
jgi:hypothetical protein